MHLKEIKTKELRWINISKPEKAEMNFLKKEFGFQKADLDACLDSVQRPRLEEYSGYLFLSINFPVYNKTARDVRPTELDLFVGKDFLVTSHQGKLSPLIDLFDTCRRDTNVCASYLANADALIHQILSRLLQDSFPIIETIGRDIDRVQGQMFNGNEQVIIRDILSIKRNIVNFRRIMQGHKVMIRRLRDKQSLFCTGVCLTLYFEKLVDDTKEIWDLLTNYKDTIDAIHETNESLVQFQLNNIMRLLTIISVIMLPAGLVASIFGMNTIFNPVLGSTGDFWILVSAMMAIALTMLVIFRKKKWL